MDEIEVREAKEAVITAVREILEDFCDGDERMEQFDEDPAAWLNEFAPKITDRVVYREDFNRWCPPCEADQEDMIELFQEWVK